jgi:uncharacterized membrane protein
MTAMRGEPTAISDPAGTAVPISEMQRSARRPAIVQHDNGQSEEPANRFPDERAMMTDSALIVAVFLACLVEAVEALTIVLAAGMARGWRSALTGTFAGVLCLAAIVAVLGPAISKIPADGLRLVVGGLLLIFGLRWLRKAVLRASGNKPLHDERLLFQSTLASAQQMTGRRRRIIPDWYGFSLAFQGVALEGLEVVFIVVTFGANEHRITLAAVTALATVALVSLSGVALRKPLTLIPENTVKFVVGVLLSAFGLFWSVEGAGGSWPGGDKALLVIIPALALYSVILVAAFRRRRPARRTYEGVAP